MLFGVYAVLQTIDSGKSPVDLIISLIFGAPFYFICIWLAYICAMAGLEFIRVVIDIENNTRE